MQYVTPKKASQFQLATDPLRASLHRRIFEAMGTTGPERIELVGEHLPIIPVANKCPATTRLVNSNGRLAQRLDERDREVGFRRLDIMFTGLD